MFKRIPLAFITALSFFCLQAQQRSLVGLRLDHYLRSADPQEMVHLYLEGPTGDVARAVRERGGTVKMKLRNWSSVRMPAGRVRELANEPAVRSIQGFGYGQTLNDSMRVKTRIADLHAGLAPLTRGYDGEDVVIGIVDTGMDLTHPDMHHPDSTTRVLYYWDHHPQSGGTVPSEFGYGQYWSKEDIDNGDCVLTSNTNGGETDGGGHGTTVAGTAAGNGGFSGQYIGAAPKADLVIVSAYTNNNPWFLSEVTDGVKFIFDRATELGKPAVVNLSLGAYLGSHDGLDPSALFIDSMITDTYGRSVVCAAGNSGCFPPYQLHMEVDGDTSFAWIRTNPQSAFGVPAAYIDFWGDSAAMNDLEFSIGADRVTGGYTFRGRTAFRAVPGTIDTESTEALLSFDGDTLATCTTVTTVRGGQYHLEILLLEPDSASYYWRVEWTGTGGCDAWDNNGFGLSEIVNNLTIPAPPDAEQYAPMADYTWPSLDRGIVDSWNCSPHVISVANYNNEQQYTAITGDEVDLGGVEGAIAFCSAYGPTRTGLQKPDLAAPGDVTFSAIPLDFIPLYLANPQGILRLGADTMHVRAGGTSIASPAVSGAVALYFQQCPYATQAQVKQALIDGAFPDEFTDLGPVSRWGAGKLDAFTPMSLNAFEVNVTSNDMLLCPDDSSEAMGPLEFEDYLWSDGSTAMNTWSQGEPLVLTVLNEQGCFSNSDTLYFTVFPEPAAPVITDAGGVLTSTPAEAYQWYLNGVEIPGAVEQQYAPTENGEYMVMITTPGGCTAESDIYTLLNTMVGEGTSSGFRVWPVPASGTLFVTVDGASAFTYDIIDAAGAAVKRGALRADGTSVLDIGALSPGTYTMRVAYGERTALRSFVVR
jgi:subtilisin family serine protease